MNGTPTFAVVGAVNHGKSSVVAALAEDDDVRVSAMPGETVANRPFRLRDLLVLIDTPGFQNARKALAALDALPDASDPLAPFATFVERHRDDPDFDAECRLLRPIVDGAGIVYVVDGSRPLRDINRCEMEILRRSGAPRLAIINRTTDDDHRHEWKGQLDQHFNLVRVFDAHEATYGDRRDLIEALASIERGWKDRLLQAVDAMEADRRQRIDEAGTVITDLLAEVLGHVEQARLDASTVDRNALVDDLQLRYIAAIEARERVAHRRLIALYSHRHVAADATPPERFGNDLFAEETWQLFGLGVRQLVGLSTLAGGIAGAGIDAVTLGHSLGLGAALGAAAGGAAAFAVGRRRPELSIDWPSGGFPGFARALLPKQALRFGGGTLVVGPFKAENFPWIVLDRALCLFAAVHARSHARRDDATSPVEALRPTLDALQLDVGHWPDAARSTAQAAFRVLRASRERRRDVVDPLRSTIVEALERVAAAERPIVRATAPRSARGGLLQSQLLPPSEDPESDEPPPESQSLPP